MEAWTVAEPLQTGLAPEAIAMQVEDSQGREGEPEVSLR